ncbi:MobF family relaxase [Nakamurella sp.]|uniref:MobF family relaxase n=1 Tax=Nakamurella sp. TaxID=1869182 RepID=UPI003B3B7418
MSLAKMASVDYLVGHVAVGDGRAGDVGASPLTRYYTAEGYPPGTWLGSGMAALGAGTMAGTEVTEEQLRALFEEARNPFTGDRLGRPPAKYPTRQERIDRRIAKLPDTLTVEARAALVEKITADEKETKTRTAVAGFDLTFSVPKSVSALWAVALAPVQEQLYLAHRAALAATFELIEAEATFTRLGRHGVRRVRVNGLVAAAFDHWDSRKGDPQLHTHVTVANRVQGPDGRWRTLDGATLHQAAVAYSDTYDLLLADEVTRRTGLTWGPRERRAGSNRRVGRELTPVPDALIAAFSQRSADIEAAVDTAIGQLVLRTGWRPDTNAINRIRQHLTLTTRDAKKAPNLAQSVQQWRTTAESVLGQDPTTWATTVTTTTADMSLPRGAELADVEVEAIALCVVDAVSTSRSTWTRWNLTAEAMRHLAAGNCQYASVEDAVAVRDRIVAAAERLSVSLTPPELVPTPVVLREPGGASPFAPAETFTSTAVLAAEDELLQLADDRSAPTVDEDRAGRVAEQDLPGRNHGLAEEDQRPAAVQIVTSGRVVEVLLGPAGTGKTTTMAGVRAMWEAQHGPGSVVGLAPSAVAAQVLADDLGIVTDNTAQWITQQDRQEGRAHRIALLTQAIEKANHTGRIDGLRTAMARVQGEHDRWRLRPGQLLIVDEAGMTGTFTLAHLARQANEAGAKLLLVGDPCQLSAVETGGAFGLLCARHPAPPTLTQVRRFVNPDGTRRAWEEVAADRLRTGDPSALADYADHQRIASGDQDQMTDQAYTGWLTDVRAGMSSVLIAADNDTVVHLNQRARADLVQTGQVDDAATVVVRNGLSVGRGDVVVTRRIDRTTSDGTTAEPAVGGRLGAGFVRNGQRWQVQRAHRDGSLTVRLLDAGQPGAAAVILTPAYVREHVDLGYATTAHRAQGLTVDTSHVLADALTQREPFYVAMTRGRYANHAYLVLDPATTLRDRLTHPVGGPADQDAHTTAQVADAITAHSGAATSAHETIRTVQDRAVSIRQLADEADTIAAYAHDLAAEDLLLTLLGDTPPVRRILDDEHFPELVLAIRHAHIKGVDLTRELPVIIGSRPRESLTADNLTTMIRTHLRSRTSAFQPTLVAGLIIDATAGLSDPEMVTAIGKRYELIEQRADHLAAEAINITAPWTNAIPASMNNEQRSAVIRVLATYRDRWDITDPTPLGKRPDDSAASAQQSDHRRLSEMLRRLTTDSRPQWDSSLDPSTQRSGRTL